MPVLPPCVIADVVIQTTNRTCKNRLYYTPGTVPTTPEQMNQIADIVRASVAVTYLPVLSEGTSLIGVATQYYAPTSELEGFSTDGASGGSATEEQMGEEVCLVIQRRTGKRGRENRGRIFISGIGEDVNLHGKVSPAFHVACESIADAIKAPLNGATAGVGTLTPKHWDRKNNTLETVTDARAMDVLMSRRDRRKPLVAQPVGF